MDTILLVFSAVAALALGVLTAYGGCLILFGLLRLGAEWKDLPLRGPSARAGQGFTFARVRHLATATRSRGGMPPSR